MTGRLQVLAEPRRREILSLIWDDELAAGTIASAMDISFGAVSQHLAKLREAGIVTVRADGRRRLYRVERSRLGMLAPVLEQEWESRMERLRQLAESEQAGTLGRDSLDEAPTQGEALEVVLTVAAAPETIFRCLTEPALLSKWLEADATIEPKPGGRLRVDFVTHDTVVAGQVLAVEHARRLVVTWGVAEGELAHQMPSGSTTVEITLEPVSAGTVVRLRHLGLPTPDLLRDHEAGWREYLANLRQAAAGGGR